MSLETEFAAKHASLPFKDRAAGVMLPLTR